MGKRIFKNLDFLQQTLNASSVWSWQLKYLAVQRCNTILRATGSKLFRHFSLLRVVWWFSPCHFAADTSIAQRNHHGWWLFRLPQKKWDHV